MKDAGPLQQGLEINKPRPVVKVSNPLRQYAESVGSLREKLDRVYSDKRAIAGSLGRAAAALRSISAARERQK